MVGDDQHSSAEWGDRDNLDLPGSQLPLLQAVAATGTPVVLVMITGRTATFGDDNAVYDGFGVILTRFTSFAAPDIVNQCRIAWSTPLRADRRACVRSALMCQTWGFRLDNITAIFSAFRPGQKGGDAIANLLVGKANPSGKLAQNWVRTVGQVGSGYATFGLNFHHFGRSELDLRGHTHVRGAAFSCLRLKWADLVLV